MVCDISGITKNTNTHPLWTLHNIKVSAETLEFDAVESLDENVGSHVRSGNVRYIRKCCQQKQFAG